MNRTIPVALCLVGTVCLAISPPVHAADDDPRAALDRKVENFTIDATLADALDKYAELADLKVRTDWAALERVDVQRDTEISVGAPSVSIRHLLDLTLAQAARKGHPLSWYLDERTIYVTTQMRVLYRDLAPARARQQPARKDARDTHRTARPPGLRLQFDDIPLADVIQFFRDVTDENFYVNWRSLETIGVSPQTPITLDVSDVSAGRALDLVVDQLGGGRDKLTRVYWIVDDGVVNIATGEALNTTLKTRIYSATDLLMVVPDFKGPRLELNANARRDSDDGGDNDLNLWDDGKDTDDSAARRRRTRENLIGAITDAIGEEMWQPIGKGSIRLMGDKLIISQTLLGYKLLSESSGMH